MRYLDPKNDFIFKRIFGEHKDLCLSLLNALLPLEKGKEIKEIEYCSSELTPEIESLKNTIVDVRCIDNEGRQFIVEMQMYWTTSFKQRVLFNASKAYVRQLAKRKKYSLLEPVYTLALVNTNFDKGKNFYHHYKIVEVQDTKQVIKGLEFVFVELEKFKATNLNEKKMMILWLRFLTEISDDTEIIDQELLDNPKIGKALEKIEMTGFTQKELDSYDKYWDIIRTERTIHDDLVEKSLKEGFEKGIKRGEEAGLERGMKKGLKKGIEQGNEKGIEKGIEQGIKKGVEKGIQQGVKQIIMEMSKNNLDSNQISKIINQPIEYINKVLQEKE